MQNYKEQQMAEMANRAANEMPLDMRDMSNPEAVAGFPMESQTPVIQGGMKVQGARDGPSDYVS